MVYIKNWTDFETAATELYARGPSKVRYNVKFSPKTGHLVLKLTDDIKCIKYKTFSSIILNRFDSLTLRLLTQMSNVKRRPVLATQSSQLQTQGMVVDTPERGGTPAPTAAPTAAAAAGAETMGTPGGAGTKSAGGGGKKKKKGKK